MRQMKLGLSIRRLGYHIAGWRLPGTYQTQAEDFSRFLEITRIAEAAKFDFVFLADGVAVRAKDEPKGALSHNNEIVELEPLTLLSALAPMTRRIGLVATSSTTYNDPYLVARRYSSLDHISGGRAAWNVVTSWSEMEALNFSREKHLDRDTRYDRAHEFVEVVMGLWDSWESDAFIHDKATGRFYDEAKLHILDHRGPHFQVRGPLTSSMTPQGRPILVQAGASDQGKELAAYCADLVYTNEYDVAAARRYYRELKDELPRYGRDDDDLKLLPGVQPFVGRTRAEAEAKYQRLQEMADPVTGLAVLYNLIGDFSGYDLDGPIPDGILKPNATSNARLTLELAKREKLTIRQLAIRTAGKPGIRQLVGSVDEVADNLEEWFTTGACDGFNICPSHLPHALHDFVDLVMPELRRRGLFRNEYEGRTLRENLGLRPYVNRYERSRKDTPARVAAPTREPAPAK